MLALSVSISTSSSPRLTSSPSDFSHFRIVPSSIESDRRGIATSAMPPAYPVSGGERCLADRREGEAERRPAAGRGLTPDAPAVALDDPAAQGEADAGPGVVLARVQALEHL